MRYKVRKGLDKELLVHGMKIPLFYAWLGIAGFFVFILMGMILQFTSEGSSLSFLGLVGTALGLFIVVLLIKVYFTKISKKRKITDRKISSIISNINILKLTK